MSAKADGCPAREQGRRSFPCSIPQARAEETAAIGGERAARQAGEKSNGIQRQMAEGTETEPGAGGRLTEWREKR